MLNNQQNRFIPLTFIIIERTTYMRSVPLSLVGDGEGVTVASIKSASGEANVFELKSGVQDKHHSKNCKEILSVCILYIKYNFICIEEISGGPGSFL